MRSYTAAGAPGRCPRCLLLLDYCLCQEIGEARPNRPEILIVRHHWEAWKSTGTARLAALALSNARILDMAAEDPEPVRAELERLAGAWLLYPGRETQARLAEPPQTLIVLDGTWRQTQKMLRRLPQLSRLPRLGLESPPRRPRLRTPPRAVARSTLESIADALGLLDSPALGQHLLALHDRFVQQTLRARGAAPSPSG
ncbi:MAG TPA: DTW domain-containing protein [Polyangiaceae bacterium]|nr:DTW domain-containing protein [Polyangiaceae bacterium]